MARRKIKLGKMDLGKIELRKMELGERELGKIGKLSCNQLQNTFHTFDCQLL